MSEAEDQSGTPPESDDPVNVAAEAAYASPQMLLSREATELMTAVKGGQVRAFETLFHRVRGSAFQAARSLVGNHEDAQDLTQEAFVKAYKARATYDPSQPFMPWFHRILRNTCFSFLRRRGRMKTHSIHGGGPGPEGEESTWEIVDEDAVSPSASAESEESSAAFAAALERLKARDREIIVLRHYQELSYKEIAAALEIPEGTVMSRLFHARKRLKALLADQVDDLVGSGGPQPVSIA